MSLNHPNSDKKCEPCEKGGRAFSKEEAMDLMVKLPEWQLADDAKSICREYGADNFLHAVRWIQSIAEAAEAEGHHPDLHLTGYKKLKVVLSTHAVGGLTHNDVRMAEKIDAIIGFKGDRIQAILVEKPDPEMLRKKNVFSWPIWEKEKSRFDWFYDTQECCYFLEGRVTVETKTGKTEIGKGDFVTFPKGLGCVWTVHEPVKKHYSFSA